MHHAVDSRNERVLPCIPPLIYLVRVTAYFVLLPAKSSRFLECLVYISRHALQTQRTTRHNSNRKVEAAMQSSPKQPTRLTNLPRMSHPAATFGSAPSTDASMRLRCSMLKQLPCFVTPLFRHPMQEGHSVILGPRPLLLCKCSLPHDQGGHS